MTTQAELTAQHKEAYVRARWQLIHECDGPYRAYPRGTILIHKGISGQWWDFESYSPAYAFTIDREEEIEALEQDIEYIERKIRIEPQFFAPKRILTRLQQALAELCRGMRCP